MWAGILFLIILGLIALISEFPLTSLGIGLFMYFDPVGFFTILLRLLVPVILFIGIIYLFIKLIGLIYRFFTAVRQIKLQIPLGKICRSIVDYLDELRIDIILMKSTKESKKYYSNKYYETYLLDADTRDYPKQPQHRYLESTVHSQVGFTEWIDEEEFFRIVNRNCKRYKKRIKQFTVDGYKINGELYTQSTLNSWGFVITFDVCSDTGNFTVSSENSDSTIPDTIAKNIKKDLLGRIVELKRMKEEEEQQRIREYWQQHNDMFQELSTSRNKLKEKISVIQKEYERKKGLLWRDYQNNQNGDSILDLQRKTTISIIKMEQLPTYALMKKRKLKKEMAFYNEQIEFYEMADRKLKHELETKLGFLQKGMEEKVYPLQNRINEIEAELARKR